MIACSQSQSGWTTIAQCGRVRNIHRPGETVGAGWHVSGPTGRCQVEIIGKIEYRGLTLVEMETSSNISLPRDVLLTVEFGPSTYS